MNIKSIASLCLLGALFCFSIYYLIQREFDEGQVFPAYSSFRSDPLGTKAFYEALDEMPGIEVRRNYRILPADPDSLSKAVFIFGMKKSSLSYVLPSQARHVEQHVMEGWRLVIAFPAVTSRFNKRFERDEQKEEEAEAVSEDEEEEFSGEGQADAATEVTPEGESPPSEKELEHEEEPETDEKDKKGGTLPESIKPVSLLEKWGVKVRVNPALDGEYPPAEFSGAIQAGMMTPWYSNQSFELTDDSPWQVMARVAGEPVLIERKLGKGTMVLMTDTYLFSNEAMAGERKTDFLLWALSGYSSVLIDEYHHGIAKRQGITSLIIKYRLHGVGASLLILLILAIWRSGLERGLRHGPPNREEDIIYPQASDSHNGMINLIATHLNTRTLGRHCAEAWLTSESQTRAGAAAVVNEALEEWNNSGKQRPPIVDWFNQIHARLEQIRKEK